MVWFNSLRSTKVLQISIVQSKHFFHNHQGKWIYIVPSCWKLSIYVMNNGLGIEEFRKDVLFSTSGSSIANMFYVRFKAPFHLEIANILRKKHVCGVEDRKYKVHWIWVNSLRWFVNWVYHWMGGVHNLSFTHY